MVGVKGCKYLVLYFFLILVMSNLLACEDIKEEENMKLSTKHYSEIIAYVETNYPDYYAGVYIDSETKVTLLMTNFTPDDVYNKVADSGLLVRKVQYSLIELYKALEEVSIYEHPSILSISIVQEKNSLVIVVNDEKELIEKEIKSIINFDHIEVIEFKNLHNVLTF